MQDIIEFEATIESGIIRIPKQYAETTPAAVKVTLAPLNEIKIEVGTVSKTNLLTANDFSALRIDTQNWNFDREEANERY